jgi:hypothetical protein
VVSRIYVKMRSWHIVRDEDQTKTVCGRTVPEGAATAEDFGDEKTCESCLRILASRI